MLGNWPRRTPPPSCNASASWGKESSTWPLNLKTQNQPVGALTCSGHRHNRQHSAKTMKPIRLFTHLQQQLRPCWTLILSAIITLPILLGCDNPVFHHRPSDKAIMEWFSDRK